ncbi:MAG TPA: hypothetical protein EYP30_07640, partial [Archaeoglobaceae archaeon]|nr:hypothetical protein [Archaeoglobaceae archaeon]
MNIFYKTTINNTDYQTTVLADGSWSVDVNNVLPDGVRDYVIESFDVAGNTVTLVGSVTIDTTTTVTGGLDASSDSGALSDDGITSVVTPLFSGTGDVGAAINLEINGENYLTTVDIAGNWSVMVTNNLSEATHAYTITAVDIAGNEDSITGDITIDDSVHLTGGLDVNSDSGIDNSDGITNQNSPDFSGTAEIGSAITLTINNQNYNTNVDATGNWFISSIDSLPDGERDYSISAIDLAGNTLQIDGTIKIDTTTTVTGRLDAASDSGVDNTDNITNIGTPTFTGTAEEGAVVTLTINNNTYSATVDNTGNWSIEVLQNLAESNHLYSILSTDLAGNTDSVQGNITIDQTVNLTGGLDSSSDSGESNSDNVTNIIRPTFSGTSDIGADIVVNINNQNYTTTTDNFGNWS